RTVLIPRAPPGQQRTRAEFIRRRTATGMQLLLVDHSHLSSCHVRCHSKVRWGWWWWRSRASPATRDHTCYYAHHDEKRCALHRPRSWFTLPWIARKSSGIKSNEPSKPSRICGVLLSVRSTAGPVVPAVTENGELVAAEPGIGIGGSSGPTLEPAVNAPNTDSASIVYWLPPGTGIW